MFRAGPSPAPCEWSSVLVATCRAPCCGQSSHGLVPACIPTPSTYHQCYSGAKEKHTCQWRHSYHTASEYHAQLNYDTPAKTSLSHTVIHVRIIIAQHYLCRPMQVKRQLELLLASAKDCLGDPHCHLL